jgi:hypothetical protein
MVRSLGAPVKVADEEVAAVAGVVVAARVPVGGVAQEVVGRVVAGRAVVSGVVGEAGLMATPGRRIASIPQLPRNGRRGA